MRYLNILHSARATLIFDCTREKCVTLSGLSDTEKLNWSASFRLNIYKVEGCDSIMTLWEDPYKRNRQTESRANRLKDRDKK